VPGEGTTVTILQNGQNLSQMLEAKVVKGREERGKKGADMSPGLNSPREHIPPPRWDLPRAKEQLL